MRLNAKRPSPVHVTSKLFSFVIPRHRFHEGPIGPHSTKHTFRDNRVLSWSVEIVVSPSLTQNIAKLCALFESTDFVRQCEIV